MWPDAGPRASLGPGPQKRCQEECYFSWSIRLSFCPNLINMKVNECCYNIKMSKHYGNINLICIALSKSIHISSNIVFLYQSTCRIARSRISRCQMKIEKVQKLAISSSMAFRVDHPKEGNSRILITPWGCSHQHFVQDGQSLYDTSQVLKLKNPKVIWKVPTFKKKNIPTFEYRMFDLQKEPVNTSSVNPFRLQIP